MGDNRIKYLEMLQGVISRMADNEFTVRKWSVGLGTGVIGYVASKDQHPVAALLAVFPAIVFWILDAYYLALETKFRELFNGAKEIADDDPSFCFDVTIGFSDWRAAVERPAVWLVHLLVLILAAIIGGVAWFGR